MYSISANPSTDFEARWKGNVEARFARIPTANEIREREGFDPIEGGDKLDPPTSTSAIGRGNGQADREACRWE